MHDNTAHHHYIVATWGSLGDVHPFLAISIALKSRGHRVTLLTNPLVEELAVNAGIDFHPIGDAAETQATLAHRDLWHPRKGVEVLWRSSVKAQGQLAEFIVEQATDHPVTIVAHPLAMQPMNCTRRVPDTSCGVTYD